MNYPNIDRLPRFCLKLWNDAGRSLKYSLKRHIFFAIGSKTTQTNIILEVLRFELNIKYNQPIINKKKRRNSKEDLILFQGFLSRTLKNLKTIGERMGPSLFFSTTSTRQRIFRYLFATLRFRVPYFKCYEDEIYEVKI